MSVPISNRFAELLDKKQKKEGRYISLAEVAKDTGISRKTLYKWEKDSVTQYDTKVVDALCTYFDVGFNDLLVHSLPEEPKQKTARK
jgi:transcriptional regulator with XRE-family HTH domain